MTQIDVSRLQELLSELTLYAGSEHLTGEAFGHLGIQKRRGLLKTVQNLLERLAGIASQLDPIAQPNAVLDPYQPEVLGRFIGTEMLRQPRHPLGSIKQFYGAGVYSIYYRGDHPAYARIKGKDTPIYVGKADPDEPTAETPASQGVRLAKRLDEHAKSIRKANNLELDHFDCRFLVVRSGLQKSAEDYLVSQFHPVWNEVIIGFGKHGDSATTRANTRSEWDTLHPGRKWAYAPGNVDNPLSAAQLIEKVREHFDAILGELPPP